MDKYLHKYIYALKKYEGRIRGGSIMDKYLGNYVNELRKYEGGMRGGFILTDAELDEKFKDLNNLDILRCYFEIAKSDIMDPTYKPQFRTDLSWTDKCEFIENQVKIIEYITKNNNINSLNILESFACAGIAAAVDLEALLGKEPEVDRIAREAEEAKREQKRQDEERERIRREREEQERREHEFRLRLPMGLMTYERLLAYKNDLQKSHSNYPVLRMSLDPYNALLARRNSENTSGASSATHTLVKLSEDPYLKYVARRSNEEVAEVKEDPNKIIAQRIIDGDSTFNYKADLFSNPLCLNILNELNNKITEDHRSILNQKIKSYLGKNKKEIQEFILTIKII